jgi:isovaleryl-CoA dehydrogenase
MVKLFVSETARKVVLEAMQMMGGYGYSSEYDMERLVRSASSQ